MITRVKYLFAVAIIASVAFIIVFINETSNRKNHQGFTLTLLNAIDNINSIELRGSTSNNDLYEVNEKIEELNELQSQSKPFRKYAIMSVSIIPGKDFYFFQLPMIVKSWEKLGYQSIILIVASEFPVQDELALKTVQYLKEIDAILVDVLVEPGFEVITSLVSR